MREEGMHTLPRDDASRERETHLSAASWCTGSGDRVLLQKALSTAVDSGFTMCYWLARATKLPRLTSM